MLTKTFQMHRCICACCDDGTEPYYTPEAAINAATTFGWCFDYAPLGILVCQRCNEQGRVPNVDEDLALAVAPDVVR